GAALLAVGEVEGRGGVQLGDVDAGGGMPDPDELVRVGKGKRFQENAFDDAEDGRVRADADRERQEGDGRERRRAAEPAKDVLELGRHRHGPEDARTRARVAFSPVGRRRFWRPRAGEAGAGSRLWAESSRQRRRDSGRRRTNEPSTTMSTR